MEKADQLKVARDIMLRLHKLLVDFERAGYERINGPLNSGQFLNVLLNESDFEWLRKFSMLIVEIDEMFDLDDGYSEDMVSANLLKIRDLVEMNVDDEKFSAKYQNALQNDPEIVGTHVQLKQALAVN